MDQMQEERQQAVKIIRDDPSGIPLLLEFIIESEEKHGFKVGWLLDLVLQEDLALILPYLDIFTSGLSGLKNESAIRPMAKICEALCLRYFSKKDTLYRQHIRKTHRKRMAESCFDWLVGDHKVAAKAYAMTALFELGKEFDWIHPELELILQANYATGSAGYKARARKVLNRLRNSRP